MTRPPRVILVSTWSPENEVTGSGAIAILSKPVDLDQLAAALDIAAGHLGFHAGVPSLP